MTTTTPASTTLPIRLWRVYDLKYNIGQWLQWQLLIVLLVSAVPALLPRAISNTFSLLLIAVGAFLAFYRPFTGLLYLMSMQPFVFLYKRLQYAHTGTLAEFNNPISLLPQIIIIVLLLRLSITTLQQQRIRKPHFLHFLICIIIGLYSLGILYSPSIIGGIFGMRAIIFPMMMFFIGRALITTTHRLQITIFVMAILVMVVTFYGLRQTFLDFHIFESTWAADYAGRNNISWFLFGGGQVYLRVFSVLATPYEFASLTMLGSFILFLHFFPIRKRDNSLRFWLFLLLVCIGLFSTAIRGAWIGAIGGWLFILLCQKTRNLYQLIIKGTYRTLILALLIPVLLSVAIVQAQGFGNALTERVESLMNPLQARQMQSRYERWSIAFETAKEHPFGLGTGSTGFTGRRFGDEAALEPDSQYIQTLLEVGWLGLIILLGFFATAFFYFFGTYYLLKVPYTKHFALVLAGICIAFALRGFTMPVLAGHLATSWFWMLLGIGTNLAKFEAQELEISKQS